MYHVKSMIVVMVATLIMGVAFTVVAIMHAGAPQNAIDASKLRQTYLEKQRAVPSDSQHLRGIRF